MQALNDFTSLDLPERISFFDNAGILKFINEDDIQLGSFLKGIVLDDQENDYVKKKALESFVDALLLNKIKPRQALGLLIDDWKQDEELFLELERLKTVFLLHELDADSIQGIYNKQLLSDETEIVAESSLRLGMIQLQNGLLSANKETALRCFSDSYKLFTKADEIIENRIDAKIYALICSILIDLTDNRAGAVNAEIQKIGEYLFKMETNSFGDRGGPLYVGLYRILINLIKITSHDTGNWLNFREGLSDLHYQYALIENENLSKRLSEGVLSETFRDLVKHKMLKPYFVLNFSARVSKLNSRITELGDCEEADFLKELLNSVREEGAKKKVEEATLRTRFSHLFPNRSITSINTVLSDISDYSDPVSIVEACEKLLSPSLSRFKDHLLTACLKIQGNRKYWNGYSEDDRNTFIANLLEATGYFVKDQTRWSTSARGKSAGEIDMFVCESDGSPFTIIEALNLDSLKQDYLSLHLDKLFNYDANGYKANFILIYCDSPNYASFCTRYLAFVSHYTYKYALVSINEVYDYPFTDIRVIESIHKRNEADTQLFHILVDLKKN